MPRGSIDRKGAKLTSGRADHGRKRKRPLNRFELEKDVPSTSASARKLRDSSSDVVIDSAHGYRILNFLIVFSEISNLVKCKTCDGDIKFLESKIRGLGFNIVVSCAKCEPKFISSCPLINNHAYEINRRIVFSLRLLGVGYDGMKKFCGLMDLPKVFQRNIYTKIVNNITTASKKVCEVLMKKAVKEECKLTAQAEKKEETSDLIVSGDGTWRKRGFSSLQGVASIIGHYTGKVLDVVVKSSYCKECEIWEKRLGSQEFLEWKKNHAIKCSANHEGNAGKMEVDGITEMFVRSVPLYGVKYLSYIGDGDSKTFKAIQNLQPYENEIVKKKECVGHVQKRMGSRLRKVKKEKKGLGGRGKLTAKLIDELSVYYGLAIRNNSHSVSEMKKAIWATFFHKCSTDENPMHDNCPAGENSWCTWRKAEAHGNLAEYHHKPALHTDVEVAIRPIYENLSTDELLERCLGGYTQNCNESFNSLIWKIAPKSLFSGVKPVKIATYTATCIFNEGYRSVLQIMDVLGLVIGCEANSMAEQLDGTRIKTANLRALERTKEARIVKRQARLSRTEASTSQKESYYEPGLAD